MSDSIKKGMFFVLTANIINLGFSLATNFLLPQFLPVEAYADIKTFQLYTSYVGILHLGYIDGMYLMYGGKKLKCLQMDKLGLSLSSLRIFQAVVMSLCLLVGLALNDKVVIFAAAAVLPLNIASYYKFLYQATGEFRIYSKILNIISIVTCLINVMLLLVVKTDRSSAYLFFYLVLNYAIWIFLELYFLKRTRVKFEITRFSSSMMGENIRSGFMLMLGNLSSSMLTTMDQWFVKIFIGQIAFAQYAFAVSVENFINVLVTPLSVTFYNFFCQKPNLVNMQMIKKNVAVFATLIVAAAFPAKFILEKWLTKYYQSFRVLVILFAAQIFYILIKCIYINLYKAHKMQKKYFNNLILIIVLGIILNLIIYYFFRVKESFSVATLITSICWYFLSNKDFKMVTEKKREHVYLFVNIISFLGCGLYLSAIPGCILYIAILSISIFILMPEVPRQGKAYIKKILNRQR